MGIFRRKTDGQSPDVEYIYADEKTGLTHEQALERVLAGKANLPPEPPAKTVGQIIISNTFTYFNLIFAVMGVCLLLVGAYNHMMFLPVVIINTLIGIIQEINAKITLDKLNLIHTPTVKAVREGEIVELETEALVRDDIVIFREGQQVCADAEILSGEVRVSEALVTGEADEILKDRGNHLLSGSFIVSGTCYARLTNVGSEAYAAKLAVQAKKYKKPQRPGMMKSLKRLIQIIGLILLPIAVLMFLGQTSDTMGLGVKESVIKTTGALTGMIPEGLYLLVSVALAVSVVRLAKKNTLVHDLGCIETLARVDVLCVDKTGTITENEMDVAEVIPIHAEIDEIETVMGDFAENFQTANHTMAALKKYFKKGGGRVAVSILQFSSATKYSGVIFDDDTGYILGAPEFILREEYEKYREIFENQTKIGNRVLLLASCSDMPRGDEPAENLKPLACIVLSGVIREHARETFEYFIRQGVEIKVLSGDHPASVSKIAEKAGIPGAGNYIDSTTLENEKQIQKAVKGYTVFGRVMPEQKRAIIKALKHAGHTVAMTGDGVNDILALKEADCSIAMAEGSEAAGQVSQLVLLNSDFSSLPAVVAEGRRVTNNIQRSASLFLVKNIFSFVLAWISILALFPYPIEPAQLTLVNAVTIGIPSFVLALEPNFSLIQGKFLRNVLYKALPAAICDLILISYVLILSHSYNIPHEQTSAMAAMLMGIVGLTMLARICRPFDLIRRILCAAMIGGFILCIALFGTFFEIVPLDRASLLIFIPLAVLSYPLMRIISGIFENMAWSKIKSRISNVPVIFKIKKKLKDMYSLESRDDNSGDDL